MGADGEAGDAAHTFLFADLTGFTALTEAHGDERAADLVSEFCREVRGILERIGGEEIKTIGDAVLLKANDAATGVRLARAIVDELAGRHGFPSIRVGVHTGPAVERNGDWFGATVNVASRVSDEARAGEVLVTRDVQCAVGDALRELTFVPRGPKRLKNVNAPVELFAATPKGTAVSKSVVTDPVCQMLVDPATAAASITYGGKEHHFCSAACARTFREGPEQFVTRRRRSELLVSDRARDKAVGFIREAYKGGRLTLGELEERTSHAYASRTRHELTTVVRDLPGYRRWRIARRRHAFWLAVFPPLRWLRRLFARR